MTKSPERLTAHELAVATVQAELHKRDGQLPAPSSSWDLTPSPNNGGLSFATRLDV